MPKLDWDLSPTYRSSAQEANRRGYNVADCRVIIAGREPAPPVSSAPAPTAPPVAARSPLRTPCDELAANPTDQRKSSRVQGAPYKDLKQQAAQAIEACETASAQYPNEPRFTYQLARALQFTDRGRAFEIHQKIASMTAPAFAFASLRLVSVSQSRPELH